MHAGNLGMPTVSRILSPTGSRRLRSPVPPGRPVPSRPASGRAGGAVPGGGRWPGPPLPRRTSGNVVRAAPLRKFFTLHVSLTAGLGFLGKGGQAGGRPRPRGEPQLLAKTRGSRGTPTLRPPSRSSSSGRGTPGCRACPGRRREPGGMWGREGTQTRRRGPLFAPTPSRRGSAPGAEGPELPRSPLLLLQTPQGQPEGPGAGS